MSFEIEKITGDNMDTLLLIFLLAYTFIKSFNS